MMHKRSMMGALGAMLGLAATSRVPTPDMSPSDGRGLTPLALANQRAKAKRRTAGKLARAARRRNR